uniref:Putative ovule protein n=1 Tax=Solanum chacoense TaxID=4108 RepID=A0A0V0H915_SOLCH
MGEWKQWRVLGSGEFPILEKLSIKNCPKLMGKLPEYLCSLTEFRISETPLFEGMKQIVELYIGNCNSVTSSPFRILPSTLKRMRITGCRELKLDPPVDEMSYCNMFLEDLYNHDELHSLGIWHLTSLQSLDIWNCHNLQSLSESVLSSSISELTIKDCPNLQSLPAKGMPFFLSKLVISNCPLLTPLLEFNKGNYWPYIAQIPIICIDDKYL